MSDHVTDKFWRGAALGCGADLAFYLHDAPLLVTEVFLPGVLLLPELASKVVCNQNLFM
jgi:hypothetical protein